MRCDELEELFFDALEGELETRAQAEFETHLQACTACSRQWEDYRSVVGHVRSDEPVLVPFGLADAVAAQLRVEAPPQEAAPAVVSLFVRFRWAAAAAVMVLAALAGVHWANTGGIEQKTDAAIAVDGAVRSTAPAAPVDDGTAAGPREMAEAGTELEDVPPTDAMALRLAMGGAAPEAGADSPAASSATDEAVEAEPSRPEGVGHEAESLVESMAAAAPARVEVAVGERLSPGPLSLGGGFGPGAGTGARVGVVASDPGGERSLAPAIAGGIAAPEPTPPAAPSAAVGEVEPDGPIARATALLGPEGGATGFTVGAVEAVHSLEAVRRRQIAMENPYNHYAPDPWEDPGRRRYTLEFDNTSLGLVLDAIEKQYDVTLVVTGRVSGGSVTMSARNLTLEEVLERLASKTRLVVRPTGNRTFEVAQTD